jgi:hypothetical protein
MTPAPEALRRAGRRSSITVICEPASLASLRAASEAATRALEAMRQPLEQLNSSLRTSGQLAVMRKVATTLEPLNSSWRASGIAQIASELGSFEAWQQQSKQLARAVESAVAEHQRRLERNRALQEHFANVFRQRRSIAEAASRSIQRTTYAYRREGRGRTVRRRPRKPSRDGPHETSAEPPPVARTHRVQPEAA